MHISADTLDDLLRHVITAIRDRARCIEPKRGKARELTGVLLELTNPRSRISATEDRGKLFSCLGELCWYLAKRADLDFMKYYVPKYRDFVKVEKGTVVGAYGPRIFAMNGFDQLARVIDTLRARQHSRNAVIVILEASDLVGGNPEAPCTSTLQFFLRDSRIDLVAAMRSNDAYMGLIHDAFAFTMLQEIVARSLSVDVGNYKHFVGNLHLYEKNDHGATSFLAEGWQPTISMPPMPLGDPWPAIAELLQAEEDLRIRGVWNNKGMELDAYWLDLIRLLEAFRRRRDGCIEGLREIRRELSFEGYRPFVDALIESLEEQGKRNDR